MLAFERMQMDLPSSLPVSRPWSVEESDKGHTMHVSIPRGMPRAVSCSSLFQEEDFLEVDINQTNSPPTSIFNEISSQGKISTSPRSSCSSTSFGILVTDVLLGESVRIKANATTTFHELKELIQQAQGIAGVRVLPQNSQRVTIDGCEYHDSDMIVHKLAEHAKNHDDDGTQVCVAVQPRIAESVAFFLSVCDQVVDDAEPARAASRPVSGSFSCGEDPFGMDSDSEDSDVGVFGMELDTASVAACRISTPPRRSMLQDRDTDMVLKVDVDYEAQLSAHTTPNSVDSRFACDKDPTPSDDSDENVNEDRFLSHSLKDISGMSYDLPACLHWRTSSSQSKQSHEPLIEATEHDSILLRAVGEHLDHKPTSHLHLMLRRRLQTLPLLKHMKLNSLVELVMEVQSGLRHGHVPVSQRVTQSCTSDFEYGELVAGCCGGTYIMSNSAGKRCAIFKPVDEEPYAPQNPKGFSGGSMNVESAMKPGICVGEGAARECAAYLLDHDGRAAVPTTAMMYITHSSISPHDSVKVQMKIGSLQRYCTHQCTAEDIGTNLFRVSDVHSVGILDVRCFNMDRNSDNVLIQRSDDGSGDGLVKLVPIDHGYMLPSCRHLEDMHVCWEHWPQARKPYDEDTLAFIESLDAEVDMDMLRTNLNLSEDSLLTLFIGTTLIQTAAKAGLNLSETAALMIREDLESPSGIEQVLASALEALNMKDRPVWDSAKLRQELSDGIDVLVNGARSVKRVSTTFRSLYRNLANHSASNLPEMASDNSDGSGG